MRNTKNTLFKLVLGVGLLLAGVQSAFAYCSGTAYIQAPASWSAVYASGQNGIATAAKKDAVSGLYIIDLSTIKGIDNSSTEFSIGDRAAPNQTTGDTLHYLTLLGIQSNLYDNNALQNNHPFQCPGEGKRTFILVNTVGGKVTVTVTSNPPNAKYIYVMIPPDMKEWMSAIPMISMDGGKTGKAMSAADSTMCGWYYYEFLTEKPTDNVVLFRDDDDTRVDMMGYEGNDREKDASGKYVVSDIPLAAALEGIDTLFFVPDADQKDDSPDGDGFYYSKADVEAKEGVCKYELAAIIYDTDASLHPLFSCWGNGADKGNDGCQNADNLLGVSKAQAHNAIYDCVGVQTGMVEEFLDETVAQNKKKPKLSSKGSKCFINDNLFNMLFNYTQGVNEKSCFDMPFGKAADGKWEFDSDFYVSPGTTVPGGFYPAEQSTNASILKADPNQTPVPAARNKRYAQGAVYYGPVLRQLDAKEGMPLIDLFCNGPGWDGGVNCGDYGMAHEHLFADGTGTESAVQDVYPTAKCVFGWSCPDTPPEGWTFYEEETSETIDDAGKAARWGSNPDDGGAGRNQHYCFESHAKFTFKPGLKFNFRGDDDIWVFIDNRLAVDLGGTHLAAPGYVNLDKFKGKSGALVTGKEYDLDIFFCDRRTTMSNVRIKTNMYIRQKVDITADESRNPKDPTATAFSMCYTKSGSGSCASAMSDTEEEMTCCGSEIAKKCGSTVQYYLSEGLKLDKFDGENAHLLDPSSTDLKVANNRVGEVYFGGIDLSDRDKPSVGAKTKMKGLSAGWYGVWVVIDGSKKFRFAKFKITGGLDVVTGNAVVVDSMGMVQNSRYNYINSSMGCGTNDDGMPSSNDCLVPIYIGAVSENTDAKTLSDYPLAIDPDGAGKDYTLTVSNGLNLVTIKADGSLDPVDPGVKRKVPASGVDTLWAWVPRVGVWESDTKTYTVKVNGRERLNSITFFLPQLAFVDTLYLETNETTGEEVWKFNKVVDGDPKTADAERLTGLEYNFYVIAYKPTPNGPEFCSTCNFEFNFGGDNSAGIQTTNVDDMYIRNGGAIFKVISKIKYPFELGNPAEIVLEGDNALITAVYTPIFFADPPCPIPAFVDIFDVEGATMSYPMNIPAPYFDAAKEYQDGIADMADVYYNRLIPKDSLPIAICITWDSTSAEKMNPAEKGYSTVDKENVLCNAVVESSDMIVTNCSQTLKDVDGNTIIDSATGNPVEYCDQRIRLKGLKLSKAPKTVGPGYVYSYSLYKDNKGNEVKKGFSPSEGGNAIIDRVGPVPLSATIVTMKKDGKDSDMDRLSIVMSEPVKFAEGVSNDRKVAPFEFFLQSALSLDEMDRYSANVEGYAPTVNKDSITVIYVTSDDKLTPANMDYVRLGGTLEDIIWVDQTDISGAGKYDSIRAVVAAGNADDIMLDASYYWNAPTGYAETKRAPTPWVEITGTAPRGVESNSFAYSGYALSDTAITIHAYSRAAGKDSVIAAENGVPGFFLKSDMLSSISLLDPDKRSTVDKSKSYLYYNVGIYTNLGAYVAGKTGRVYCDDAKNLDENHATYFDGKSCDQAGTNRNYYIGWNMRSDEGREVGSGAYIAKVETFIKITYQGGSKKDVQLNETFVWGVKKSAQKVYVKTESVK